MLKVNGQAVNNLQDLVAAVQASKGQYLQFDLEYNQVGLLPGDCTAWGSLLAPCTTSGHWGLPGATWCTSQPDVVSLQTTAACVVATHTC